MREKLDSDKKGIGLFCVIKINERFTVLGCLISKGVGIRDKRQLVDGLLNLTIILIQ